MHSKPTIPDLTAPGMLGLITDHVQGDSGVKDIIPWTLCTRRFSGVDGFDGLGVNY